MSAHSIANNTEKPSLRSESFQFPYQAYPIQVQMMNAVYEALREQKIGLFESPTGTGKSLSLFCAAMKWLSDMKDSPLILDEDRQQTESKLSSGLEAQGAPANSSTPSPLSSKPASSMPSWITSHKKKKEEDDRQWKRQEHRRVHDAYQERLNSIAKGEDVGVSLGDKTLVGRPNSSAERGAPPAKRSNLFPPLLASSSSPASMKTSSIDESPSGVTDDFLMKDYESDEEKEIDEFDTAKPSQKGPLHRTLPELISKEDRDLDEYPLRKIFFCSRTHSQLSQFIQETHKTAWAKNLRLVILGSRKTMCINNSVNKLITMNQINDKCLDMISSAKSASMGSGDSGPALKIGSISSSSTVLSTTLSTSSGSSISYGLVSNPAFGLVPDEPQASLCHFLHEFRQKTFRDHILALPRDIEELVEMGKAGVECPYYATRSAVQLAEIVVLPYNTLLHRGTREALGIDLKGSVVILDEAHNLIDTVNAIHSVELNLTKMSQALSQLTSYLDKFNKRLKLKNISYIEKIIAILRNLIKYLVPIEAPTMSTGNQAGEQSNKVNIGIPGFGAPKSGSTVEGSSNVGDFDGGVSASIVNLNDFLFESKLDMHNLFKIERYLKESDLIHKVQGYCQSSQVEVAIMKHKSTLNIHIDESEFEKHRPALGMVSQFLATLTSQGGDGTILVTRHASPQSDPKLSSLKFILLNPEIHFQDVLLEARSVILAGGTMQPFGDFVQHLLSGPKISPSRIRTFTCSHIIPDSNLSALVFATGPTGFEFHFTHENRQRNLQAFDEIARLVHNLCNVVPDGVVIFSPSYNFENSLIERWKTTGEYDKISAKKPIFREPKTSSSVDLVLADYERSILKNTGISGTATGAILSCVVGGKLSEGINFKDHLGRCVILLGLPFPNAKDPILVERLAHINHKLKSSSKAPVAASSESLTSASGSAPVTSVPSSSTSSQASQPNTTQASSSSEYYENLCMKAVNQSIGRSIRHIGDYATIVLVDKRYNKPSIQAKLPEWIRKRLMPTAHFGEGIRHIVQFFQSKSSNQQAIFEKRREEHR